MSKRIVRAVLALYPRAFRRRYGPEVRDLVEELEGAGEESRLRLLGGLLACAAAERLRATRPTAAVSIVAVVAVAASATILALQSTSPTHHVTGVAAASVAITAMRSAAPGPGPIVSPIAVSAPTPTSTVDGQTWIEHETSLPPPPPPTRGSRIVRHPKEIACQQLVCGPGV